MGECQFPRTAVLGREMLFANCIYTSTVQSFNLFAVCCLQRTKHSYIAWLELVGGVGRKTTENDIFLNTKGHDF